MDEQKRLSERALAARAGHQRARRDPAYANAVRDRLARRPSASDADLVWIAVATRVDTPVAAALRQWLDAPGEVDLDALERALDAAGTPVTMRVLLTQHPHSGAFFEWSTPKAS
ncbi:MAG: hypothetical protein IV100_22980 [Myxococcales bacterium]|nr:hypothetical protein [Myxococcales bacterium]